MIVWNRFPSSRAETFGLHKRDREFCVKSVTDVSLGCGPERREGIGESRHRASNEPFNSATWEVITGFMIKFEMFYRVEMHFQESTDGWWYKRGEVG